MLYISDWQAHTSRPVSGMHLYQWLMSDESDNISLGVGARSAPRRESGSYWVQLPDARAHVFQDRRDVRPGVWG
jgi:hypothetical protein